MFGCCSRHRSLSPVRRNTESLARSTTHRRKVKSKQAKQKARSSPKVHAAASSSRVIDNRVPPRRKQKADANVHGRTTCTDKSDMSPESLRATPHASAKKKKTKTYAGSVRVMVAPPSRPKVPSLHMDTKDV